MLPAHPAYNKPDLPSVAMRKFIFSSGSQATVKGDPEKAVKAVLRLAELPNPPLRLPLGQDCVKMYKEKIASLVADVESYESWSDDVNVD